MKTYRLSKQELEDFNKIISHDLIPELIKYADKHGFVRDSIIKYAADLLKAISETATFENYKEG